jgi:hypothetical protein
MRIPVIIEIMKGRNTSTKPMTNIATARSLKGLSSLVLSEGVFLVMSDLKNPAMISANPSAKMTHMTALHQVHGALDDEVDALINALSS